MDELAILERILKPLAGNGAFGFRDDAARLDVGDDSDLVVTKDMLAEGVHFLADDPAFTIAQKALRVNLSDLAAKGATPVAYMLGLALGPEAGDTWLSGFGGGLAADQKTFGMSLLGGDTIAVPHGTLISVTAFGAAPRGTMVHRFGGRLGDLLYVSGAIGEAALGLRLLKGEADPALIEVDEAARLVARYRVPSPRVGLAPALGRFASAAMDVSDGLVGDCDKLAAASGCGAVIETERVPLASGAAFGVAPETLLTAGDDYEILAAIPPAKAEEFEAAAAAASIVVTRIGALRLAGGATEVRRNGAPVTLGARAWVHGDG